MAKRKYSAQLPAVLQTETNKQFFSATVDQLFQPGVTTSMNAFIGRKPSYFNELRDFYKAESTAERQFYQLEPAMTATAGQDDSFADILFYQDLVNNLRFQGADVSNHSRLFESEMYSWCPPIDVNKLVNYRDYYWLPDGPPVLVIDIPTAGASSKYVGDGVTSRFAIPYGTMTQRENILVKVDGATLTAGEYNKVGTDIVLVRYDDQYGVDVEIPLEAESTIEIWLDGDYVGDSVKTRFSLPPLIVGATVDVVVHVNGSLVAESQYTVGTNRIEFITAPARGAAVQIWGNANFINNVEGKEHFTLTIPARGYAKQSQINEFTGKPELIKFPEIVIDTPPALERFMRVEIRDNMGENRFQVSRNSENQIVLGPFMDMIDRSAPLHTVIDKQSPVSSPWSRTNHWYHADSMFYFYDNYKPKKATRPIIEFMGDLRLWNYGLRRLEDVNHIVNVIREDPWQFSGWSSYHPSAIFNSPAVEIDGRIAPLPTGRVMFNNSATDGGNVDIRNQILNLTLMTTISKLPERVARYDSELITYRKVGANSPGAYVGEEHRHAEWSNYDNDVWDPEYELTVTQHDVTTELDIFKMVDTDIEHYFLGGKWNLAQEFKFPFEPLFELYDQNSILGNGEETHSYSDQTFYPNTTFRGNRIFGYKHGTGKDDSVLGFPLVRNKFGNLSFEDVVDSPIAYGPHIANGLKFFAHTNVEYSNVEIDPIQGGLDYDQSTFDSSRFVTTRYANNWVPAGTSSQEKSEEGFYHIPLSLQANPKNEAITTISMNDWNYHLKPILEGTDWKTSPVVRDLSLGRSILQHRSPLLRTMLLNSSSDIDFVKSALYNEREYVRTMNKFAQTLEKMEKSSDITNTVETVDQILRAMRLSKTKESPFHNSGMAGGNFYIPVSGAAAGVTPLWKPEIIIEVSKIANIQTTMIRGHDGSLVPGHTRGTLEDPIVPGAFDYKDLALLEFQNRIYQNVDPKFVARRRASLDIPALIPGKYRGGDYTYAEFINVCRPLFERWCAQGQLNYRATKYNHNNAWTYNYSRVAAWDGSSLQGNWRGIYRHYFDTDRPHSHPWEMLGFTSKPSFWDSHYSWLDASKRAALLLAIETGLVNPDTGETDQNFARPGSSALVPVNSLGELIDPISAGIVGNFGFHHFDEQWEFGDGSPIEMQWWNSHYGSFTLAQLGYLLKPARFVESTWLSADEKLVHGNQWVSISTSTRTNADMTVMHGELLDGVATTKMGIQSWVSDYLRSQGKNITTMLGDHVRTLGVNLAHKLGGYVDEKSIKVFTETTGLLPQEDVKLSLYRSPSVREEFYGGVITEWMGRGWRLLGYDIVDPVFKIKQIVPSGRRVRIALSDELDTINDWRSDTYYTVKVRIHHDGVNYVSARTHTSGKEFEEEFWTVESIGRLENAQAVAWYFDHEEEVTRIPYGTILTTRQEVSDFLSGYQAYLESRGWDFKNFDYNINDVLDFKYSLREFMYWTETKWTPGSFISLSPSSQLVKFTTTHGTVQKIDQLVNGAYSVVDRAGMSIPASKITTSRLDDDITVSPASDQSIFGLRVYVNEIENALVFNNSSIFDDVLYEPKTNLRHQRVRVIANLSQDWVGRLDAPGFVVTDTALMPSFEQQVQDIRHMYDIEKAINLPLRDNARHQIGYESRDYLEPLMFNDINQFEFYQGMIQQKGTSGVLNKLMRNDSITSTKSISFMEEWAFRAGEYGGTEKYETFEFILNKHQIKAEPQQVHFVSNNSGWDILTYENTGHPVELKWDSITLEGVEALDSQEDTIISIHDYMGIHDRRWITPKKGMAFDHVADFKRVKSALPTAGYARVSDTKFQAHTVADFNTLISGHSDELSLRDRVWIYSNEVADWDIFRASVPHKSPVVEIFTSMLEGYYQLNNFMEVLTGGSSREVSYHKFTTTSLPDDVVVGSIVSIIDDRSPLGVGISGSFEVKAIDGPSIIVSNKASELVAFTPALNGVLITLDSKLQLQVGDYVYLTKDVLDESTTMPGMHRVVEMGPTEYSVVIDAVTTSDVTYDVIDTKPQVFKMVSVRFQTADASKENRVNALFSADLDELSTRIPADQWGNGELLYVDVCYNFASQDFLPKHKRRWAVYKWQDTGFTIHRSQPSKIKRAAIKDVKLFETISTRTDRTLNAKPLINAEILILDPNQGLVPGVAQKEIAYKLEYDPAAYNEGSDGDRGLDWGEKEVGRLWWDLSTTRFLISETDVLHEVSDRDVEELEYRARTWGSIAPGSSIDIYEWTSSRLSPSDWVLEYAKHDRDPSVDGEIYMPGGEHRYVESTEWDDRLGKFVPVYFFWVKNRLHSPNNNDARRIAAYDVSKILSNPFGQDMAWIAPIGRNHLITSGLTQYLTKTSSMQIKVDRTEGVTERHVEWQLMRKGDERSLPDANLWNKIVRSLAGKTVWGESIPSASRYFTDRIGFDVERGQTIFSDMKSARRHMVEYLNSVLSKTLIVDERRDVSILTMDEGKTAPLVWAQKHDSYYIKPIPFTKLWTTVVDTVETPAQPIQGHRESNVDFAIRMAMWKYENNSVINQIVPYEHDTGMGSLLRNLRMGEAYWSVLDQERWDSFDDSELYGSQYDGDQVINDLEPISETNPWSVGGFEWDVVTSAKLFDYEVSSGAEMAALLPVPVGTRVKVRGGAPTGNFWLLYEYTGDSWKFIQTQRYGTADAWSFIDWYADGFNALEMPQHTFQSVTARDQAFISNHELDFVKVMNDGKGRWMWTVYRDGVWEVVAKQNGTIKLSDLLWVNTGNEFDPSRYAIPGMAYHVNRRDMGYEIDYLLNTLRDEILTDEELNGFFFSMIEHAHAEQDYIDWAFKTSYMNVTGFGDKLTQSPIKHEDLTQNMLEYIKEVKPYHVKVRDYISKYRISPDAVNTHVTDYDKPVYVDPVTGVARVLSPYKAEDINILNRSKWVHWYDQWRLMDQGKADRMPLVRSIKVTSTYLDIAKIAVSESLRIRVMRKGDSGGSMIEGGVESGVSGAALFLDLENPLQNSTAAPVFADGLRVDPEMVSYQASDSTVIVDAAVVEDKTYEYVGFGYGATEPIRDVKYFNKTEAVQEFDLGFQGLTANLLHVTLDGEKLEPSEFTVLDKVITITTGTLGFLAVGILELPTGKFDDVMAFSFKDLVGKTFVDLYPELANPTRHPLSNNFIFEVNGYRKQPEWIYNLNICSLNNELLLDRDGPVGDLVARFQGAIVPIADRVWKKYTLDVGQSSVDLIASSIPAHMQIIDAVTRLPVVFGVVSGLDVTNDDLSWNGIDDTWNEWDTDIDLDAYPDEYGFLFEPADAEFAVHNGKLIRVGPANSVREVLVSVDHFVPESFEGWLWGDANQEPVVKINDSLFWVAGSYGRLCVTDTAGDFDVNHLVLDAFPDASIVTITDFRTAKNMGVITHSWHGSTSRNIPVSAHGPNDYSYWVNFNGRRLINGVDYDVTEQKYDYDELDYDADGWDSRTYYLHGMVAGQYLGGYDGYRNYGMQKKDADAMVPGNRYRSRRYDFFDWDREVISIKLRTIVPGPDDVIIATVFSEEQATFNSEFEVFTQEIKQAKTTREDMIDDSYGDVLLENTFTLVDALTLDSTSVVVEKVVSPFRKATQLAPSGSIWVGTELIHYASSTYDAFTGQTTLADITRGTEITTWDEHEVGTRCVITTQMEPIYMPL